MDEAPATVRPRGRFRPGLRAMMLLIVAIAVAFGWFGHRARVQRDAVAAILKPHPNRRVSVYYDWQFQPSPATYPWMSGVLGVFDDLAKPPGPKWLREALGPDLFDTPVLVIVDGDGIDDAFLGHLGKLRGVEILRIQGRAGPGLTAAGMARLDGLDRLKGLEVKGLAGSRGFIAGLAGKAGLRRLWLPDAAATDDDMAVIGGLSGLEVLQLDGRNVTDRGFAHVAHLRSLTSLELPGARITDLAPVAGLAQLDVLALAPAQPAVVPDPNGPASLEPLRGLTKLTRVALGSTRAGDRDLAIPAALPRLSSIALGGKGITGAGLAQLAASPSLVGIRLADTSVADLGPLGPRLAALTTLWVEGSPLTDAGVEPLAKAARPVELALAGTEVTDAGLARLANLTSLWHLRIDRARITDAGLARLAPLRSLKTLSLSEVGLTDASVPAIAAFPALEILHLDRSGISPAGVDRLRQALPRVRISTGPPPG